MNNPAEIIAKQVGGAEELEAKFLSVRDPINHSLAKAREIRHAILTFELELAQANAKFKHQLQTIEDNFK